MLASKQAGATRDHARSARKIGAASLLSVALLGSACSLGDKQAQATRIRHSAERLGARGPAFGTAAWAFDASELPFGAVADPQSLVRRFAPFSVPFVADLRRDRAQVGPVDKPASLYDGAVVFVRRVGASTGLSSREWSRLDFAELDRDHSPGLQAVIENVGPPTAALVHPVHLMELVAGTLTGSVKRVGVETLDGVATTHYKASISLDNADRELHLSERVLDARRAALAALAVKGDVVPAEVWIDQSGRLRRLQVRLTQRPARKATLHVTAVLDIVAVSEGAPAGAPPRRQYVRVDTPSELVRSLRGGASL